MALNKYIIERDIPDVGTLEREQLRGAAAKSNEALAQLAPDVQWVESYVAAEGLKRSADFKLWMMVEVPSNIFLIEKFLEVGIDGISIGSNDLTQLILGIDRDSEKLAETFDERNEAVLIALERAIKVSKSMGVTSSICGQAPSVYPELTEKLVEWGITSVSVSRDMIDTTKEIIATVLGERFPVIKSYANIDPIFNLPLRVLLDIRDSEKFVAEMGVDGFGQMDKYLTLVQPRIGVVTRFSLAHSDEEHFGSLEGLIEEKTGFGSSY